MTTYSGQVVEDNPNTYYFTADFSINLMSAAELENLGINPEIKMWSQIEQNEFRKKIKKERLDLHNKICYLSSYKKGLLFIDHYRLYMMPQFKDIVAVQDEMYVVNDEGDELKFITDFTAIMSGKTILSDQVYVPPDVEIDPNEDYLVVVDNKTSSMNYTKMSVRESPQLSLYSNYYNTDLACYAVLQKKINKKLQINHQIIVDKIIPNFQSEVFDNMAKNMDNIKAGIFEKNENSCFNYGRRCEYFDLCKHNEIGKLYRKDK
jgi:hypothetical protein